MATTTATRRLAAILAADVVGYSRLMGADEEGTHERLKAHLYLAFVNLEELAKVPTMVTNLLGITIRYLDIGILTEQEEYLDFVDHSLSFLNHEGRYLKANLPSNPVPAPAPHARPPLYRP
jgi:hypothetical protein